MQEDRYQSRSPRVLEVAPYQGSTDPDIGSRMRNRLFPAPRRRKIIDGAMRAGNGESDGVVELMFSLLF